MCCHCSSPSTPCLRTSTVSPAQRHPVTAVGMALHVRHHFCQSFERRESSHTIEAATCQDNCVIALEQCEGEVPPTDDRILAKTEHAASKDPAGSSGHAVGASDDHFDHAACRTPASRRR